MRATFMYGAEDVRVETVPDPVLQEPTDALVRVVRACICGSDLHPYRTMPAGSEGSPMGHEFVGVVEETGSQVVTVKRGDLVIAPFAWSDGTCEFCREGLQTSCLHGGHRCSCGRCQYGALAGISGREERTRPNRSSCLAQEA